MGKFEQDFFRKHFKSIDRLIKFRKSMNDWNKSHHGSKGIIIQCDPHKTHYEISNDTEKQTLVDEHNRPVKFIYLTKQKIDKEIQRRLENGES